MRSAPPLAALTLAVAVLLTGCVPQDPDVTPPPEQTSEPVFASDEEALAAATDAYKAYLAMSDLIAQEGGANPERIHTVAVGEAAEDALEGYAILKEHQFHSAGASQATNISLQRYSDSGTDHLDVAAIYACLDLSNVDVLDASGMSVVEASRPDVQSFEVTFDFSPDEPASLVVASRQPWAGEEFCAS